LDSFYFYESTIRNFFACTEVSFFEGDIDSNFYIFSDSALSASSSSSIESSSEKITHDIS